MNTLKNISLLGRLFVLIIIGSLGFAVESNASHIVGGDMTYKCLGNDNYEVTLRLRRDCLLGNAEAQFDDPAVVGIFSSTGTLLTWFGPGGTLLIPFVDDDTLNTTLESDCGFLGSPVCVQQTVYKKTVKLPPRPGGYILAYQRCCRNMSLANIEEPELTGSTYYVALNDASLAACNSTPTFDEWADIYICANQALVFDHGATDAEGDELVYSLCTPSQGATFNDNTPLIPSSPPYATVTYTSPYSVTDMMGGGALSIDPQTGELTATPNLVGQFLIGVCVEEYRNGVKLSTVRRDFEYNVRECGSGTTASFTSEDVDCDDLEMEFTNTSSNADSYAWYYVNSNNDTTFVSNVESPTIIFPSSGTYTVILEATRDTDDCTSIFTKDVSFQANSLVANFEAMGLICDAAGDNSIVINNLSIENDGNYSISGYSWTVTQSGVVTNYSGENPDIVVGDNTSTTIDLVVTSSSGCTASSTQTVGAFVASLDPSFDLEAEICGNEAVLNLTDTSVENQAGESVNSWAWTVTQNGMTYTASGQTASIDLPSTDPAEVTLVVGSSSGCEATISQNVDPGTIGSPNIILSVDNCSGALTVYQVESETTFPGQVVDLYEWTITIGTDVITGTGNPFTFETDGMQAEIDLKVTFDDDCFVTASSIENLDDAFPSLAFNAVIEDCLPNGNVIVALFDQTNNPVGFNPETYTWFVSNGANTDILSGNPVTWEVDPSMPANAVMTVEYDNDCILESEIQDIPLNNALSIEFTGNPIVACVGETVFLVANPNDTWTYTWDPIDGLDFGTTGFMSNPSVMVTGPATYNVTVSDGLCETTGSVSIELMTGGTITVSGDRETCDGNIELTASGGSTGSSYNWSLSPDMNPIDFTGDVYTTTIPAGTTTVYVQATGGNGCDSDILEVVLTNNALELEIVQPFMMCRGDTANLIVLTSQMVTFEWEDDPHLIDDLDTCCPVCVIGTDEPNGSVFFDFTATNAEGCTASFTYEVIIVDNPELDFTWELGDCGTYTVCFTNTTGSPISGIPAWDFGDGSALSPDENPCYTYSGPGTYDVTFETISSLCPGVPITQTIEVPEIPEVSLVGGAQEVVACPDDEITIIATSNLPDEEITWCDSNGTPLGTGGTIVITAVDDLVIIAKVEDANGCTDESETFTINVYQFAVSVESAPSFICVGGTGEIVIVNATPGENLSYAWAPAECIVSGGDTANPTISANTDKTFTVSIVNEDNGCVTELQVPVSISEPSIEAITDAEIMSGETATIEVVGTSATDMILWDNGSDQVSQDVMPTETTTYVVTVTDENGCSATDDVTITVRNPVCEDDRVFLPNAFSPNADGSNDLLVVRLSDPDFIEDIELIIYDRWGEEVYKNATLQDATTTGWDGRFENETLSPDVYAYCLKVVCSNNEEVVKLGNVTLLK